jgi:cell division septation protein DedD
MLTTAGERRAPRARDPVDRLCRGVARIVLVAVASVASARALAAQASTDSDSAAFARAQVLVSAGEGKEGRAVVDSVLARTPTGSLRYAEGLFWRATLASNALDAERDYRRIAVEYVLSPRVPAALTRLAQLELARGDRTLARQHLERLLNEYPPRDARADAWYWLGRIAFESGDASRGCVAIDSARRLVGAENVELSNQIASDARRCLTRADGSLASATPPVQLPAAAMPPAPDPVPASGKGAAPAKAAPAGQVTIQVGAYPARATADKVRKRLTAQGFHARVVPAGRYYRVRVGRYPTRASAAPVVAKLKARHYETMVTDAEPAP